MNSLPPSDWSVSRSGFTTKELKNGSLDAVVKESKSGLCKDLEILITDYFNNNEIETLLAAPLDIKNKFFPNNQRYEISYIRTVLKNEFKMQPERNQRYSSFGDDFVTRTGTPFLFYRKNFVEL